MGGGVIFNQKIYLADFGPLNRAFWAWNLKKKLQHNHPNMRGGGVKGHLKLFWKFICFGVANRPHPMYYEKEVNPFLSFWTKAL